MPYRMYRVFTACLGAVALILAANETFAASTVAHGGASISTHPTFRPLARPFGHRRANNNAIFWPTASDYGYGDVPPNGEPTVDAPPSGSRDIHHTYTYDVPWDAVHRFPPAAVAATPYEAPARPYVGCRGQNVTVPGSDGKDQTVNIVRCY